MFLFRKLIIAVLALGLVLSFGSAAFSEQIPARAAGKVFETKTNAPLFGESQEIPRNIPAFEKPSSDMQALTPSRSVTLPNGDCTDIDYSGGSAYYSWDLPDSYGDTEFSQRFTPDGACTLTAIWVAFDFDATVGSPDLQLTVYGDDGFGYPDGGNIIHQEIIPNASLPTTGSGYFGITGLAYEFADGEEFHIAWATVQNDPSDVLVGFSDDGASGDMRSAELWNGAWGFMLDDWSLDVNFLMSADVCYEDVSGLQDDCYTQSYACNLSSYWATPGSYGINYYSQRFSPDGPETLKTVYVAFYGPVHDASEVRIFGCMMDAGFPDTTNMFMDETVAFGDMVFYPDYVTIDVSGLGLVLDQDFAIGWNLPVTATGSSAGLSDDGETCPAGRSYAIYGGAWYDMLDLFGASFNYLIDVDLCRDVYAECHWEAYEGGPAYIWSYPDAYDQTAFAVRISPALGGCDISLLDVWLYDSGVPYAYDAEFAVYAADGVDGLPGTKLLTVPMPASSIVPGAWNTQDVGGQLFYEEDVWIAVETFAPLGTPDITFVTDDGTTPSGRTATGYSGSWLYMIDDYGTEYNPFIEAYVCCVPLQGRVCADGEEWPTMGKNFTRENSSLNGIGGIGTVDDPRCLFTKDWDYVGPNWAQYNSPVISDDVMVIVMTDHVVWLNALTGAEIHVEAADNVYIGGSNRGTPTIYNGNVYFAGGDAQGFNCFDLAGNMVWQRSINGFAVYGPSVVLNIGGTDVVYTMDDFGQLYAFDAATGADFFGSQPFFSATGFTHKALTTDGTNLYVGCDNGAGQPNLYKIDAATGTEVINFVDDGDGFQLATLHSNEFDAEGIFHSMVYEEDNGSHFLYFATSYSPQNQSPVTNGGLMYKVNTDDFTIEWVQEANGSTGGAPGGVVMDLGQVIFGGWSNWINGGTYWGPTSYSKSSGAINFTQTVTNPNQFQHALSAALLTCETVDDNAIADWLIWGSSDWYYHFLEATTGTQVFHRRTYFGTSNINAPIMNEEYVYLGALDFIAAMKNQATPRPRLELPVDMEVRVSVEFGLGDPVDVTFPDVIYNNGCADLTVNGITIDSDDNGTWPLAAIASVNPRRNIEVSGIADEMASKYPEFIKAVGVEDMLSKDKASSLDHASFATPVWFHNVVAPTPGTIVSAGSYEDITISIDGTQLPRGYNLLYAYVATDDPDYFLDYAYMDNNSDYGVPSVKLAIIGGCLPDKTILTFGNGGANFATLYNSTKIFLDTGEDDGWLIDGDQDNMYAADGFCFGWQDTWHTVFHWEDPFSNVEATWNSILPDPYVDQDCQIWSGTAQLANMSTDNGATYTPINGTIINYAYVDSIQEFRTEGQGDDDFSSWDWEYPWSVGEAAYSDTLSEGYAFRGMVAEYGIVDVPEFNNFVISRHSVYSRYGYAINDMYMACYIDYDVGDYDLNRAGYNADYSVAWMYDRTVTTEGWGAIKVPFGPGFEPMKNAYSTTYPSFLQDPEPNFDSLFVWMSDRTGLHELETTDDDRRLFFTLGELDLPAWNYDPLADKDDVPDSAFAEVGAVLFGFNALTDMTDPEEYGPTALFVNKFCGFGRGDVNDDGNMNLIDIIYLNSYVFHGGNGPFPFEHLGDVNGDGALDVLDIIYMIDWYFNAGPAPVGEWALPRTTVSLP